MASFPVKNSLPLLDESKLKRVEPNENMPGGILLYAVSKNGESRWLILVSEIEIGQYKVPHITRHVSFDYEGLWFNYHTELRPEGWGTTISYDFYIATPEQKKFIIKEMTSHGIRYVKALNRLIER